MSVGVYSTKPHTIPREYSLVIGRHEQFYRESITNEMTMCVATGVRNNIAHPHTHESKSAA